MEFVSFIGRSIDLILKTYLVGGFEFGIHLKDVI
jgi:hypothetical protein